MTTRAAIAFALLAASACGPGEMTPPAVLPPIAASPMMALAPDGRTLWVVGTDEDEVAALDVETRAIVAVVPLGPAPAPDPATGRYEPRVKPRALALLPDGSRLYVAGRLSGRVHVVDTAARAVVGSVEVGAAPTAVVAAPDGRAVYVACHESGTLARIDTDGDTVAARLDVGEHPWGLSRSADGAHLYVTRFLLDPGVTVVDAASFSVVARATLADRPRDRRDKRLPNGVARGLYAARPHPVTGELWTPHLMLAVETAQPALDFESTVFPAVALLDPSTGAERRRLLFQPTGVRVPDGAFGDSVSGPRAIDFTPDGSLALVLTAASEDLLVFDGKTGFQSGLVRPIPSTFPEDVLVDTAGRRAYVLGRSSGDVTVLRIDTTATAPVIVDGAPIPRRRADPMPADLRLGQRLFYSANSAWTPITRNFWVACSSCHLEGGSDAVTWLFEVGPRDTPSNAGGMTGTGFLLRQAGRNSVVQYDTTINVEQGGRFDRDDPTQRPLLDALAAFVDRAIPLPPNPHRAADGALTDAQRRGQALFAARCASCHPGERYTDSGQGNPTLDPTGPVVLHDVGTCVTSGPHPDRASVDDSAGRPRAACEFDTPTLRGVFASAPYLHDGSARTLGEAIDRMPGAEGLTPSERADLVEFVRSL